MIKVLRMINGEEIVVNIVNETETVFEVKTPAQLMMQQTEQGVGVGLAPYMPYIDGNHTFYKSAVAVVGSVDIKMENEYNRIFGSGIQIVAANALPQG